MVNKLSNTPSSGNSSGSRTAPSSNDSSKAKQKSKRSKVSERFDFITLHLIMRYCLLRAPSGPDLEIIRGLKEDIRLVPPEM